MSLPGKLCVGILEEDNPLRSYFRFKPLLVEENGRYIPFEDHEHYPDEGCIRIVPDKNESYYFKSRMRQNGLFSVVDLRDHPNENDKIRPNKNYRHSGEEINAYIIYSDVVRGPAADMIYQLLPAEAAKGPVAAPHTPRVLLKQDNGVNPVCHEWEPVDESGEKVLLKPTDATVAVGDFQVFDVPGFRGETLSFLIKPAALMAAVCDTPERPQSRHESAPAAPDKRDEKPVPEREKPAPAEHPNAKAEAPSRVEAAPRPETVSKAEPAAKAEPALKEAKAEKPAHAQESPVSEAAPEQPDKPWIHHDERMLPPPIDRRLSRAEQLLAAQAGLNPRRGRSLQELIDEKWQHSRLNQLGTPVSPITTGTPVKNPVDAAMEAIRAAWDNPQTREPLLDALTRVDCFKEAVRERREQAMQSALAEQLNALEAQRLELMADIERLKAGSRQVKDQLKQEIRRDEAADLADAVEKTRAAQAEMEKYAQLASDARKAAEDARGALDQLVGDQLEAKIRDVALTQRVQERLELLKGAEGGASLPPTPEKIGINAFIDRMAARAEAAGWSLSREEIANLCVCLALSPVLLLSGGPGSGKTSAARMLAEALGTETAGRSAIFAPGPKSLCGDKRLAELRKFPGIPATVILDDANLAPSRDVLRGMAQCANPEWRVIATLQDAHSGLPLSANALDQGFVVRLSVPADLPWQSPVRSALPPETPVSIEGIRASMPRAEVPAALVAHMNDLRKAMADCGAQISRRALDDTWRYCSTMLALLGRDADADALFDRAVAQRLLPATLAAAPIEAVIRFRELTEGMPICHTWLSQPLPFNL